MNWLLLTMMLAAAEVSVRPGLSLPDVDSPQDLRVLATAVSSTVATEVQRTQAFTVTSADQIRALLSLERQRALLGCDGDCGPQVKVDLDTRYLLTAKLARIGNELALTFTLLDLESAKRVSSDTARFGSERALFDGLRPLLLKVLRPALQAEGGALALRCTESGAQVRIDDDVVGVTPLPTSVAVGAGVHFVTVSKDGFVSWTQEVRVPAKQVGLLEVTLAPSPDTLAEWNARQQRLRLGAWSTTALAVVGVASGLLFIALANDAYGSESGTGFLRERYLLQQGVQDGVDHRVRAGEFRAQVQLDQLLTGVALGVGAASAVTATALWLLTDDPSRYSALQPSVQLAPIPGGAMGALRLSF